MKQLVLSLSLLLPARLVGAQSFAAPVSYYAGNTPFALATADLNRDGNPDVVTALYNSSSVGVLLGTSTGTFASVVSYRVIAATGYNVLLLAVRDVNGDNYPDIVAIDQRVRQASVLLNSGTGTFSTYVTYPTSGTNDTPINCALADVTGDSYPDLVTVNNNSQAPTASRTVSVLRNNGNGTFATPVLHATGSSDGSAALAVADVNNDGALDLLTTYGNAGQVAVLLNTGSGAFAVAGAYATGLPTPATLRVGDLNRDGYADVVVLSTSSPALSVLRNNQSGAFVAPTTYTVGTASGENLTALTVADVNGDTYPDVVTGIYGAQFTSKVGVQLNNRAGALGTAVRFSGTASVEFLEAADVNRDGKPDLLALSLSSFMLDVRLNQTVFLATSSPLASGQATVWPNPAVSHATLTATGLPMVAQQLEATVLTSTGQLARHLTLPVAQGEVRTALALAGLAPGLYLLRLVARDAQGTAVAALPGRQLVVAE